MGAQVLGDLAKRPRDVAELRVEVLAAGPLRQRDQRMLPARIPPGVVQNRQVDQRVDHHLAANGLVKRLLEVDALDRIAAIRNDDERLAPRLASKHLRREVDSVIERRRRPVVEIVQTPLQMSHVGRERNHLAGRGVEVNQVHTIHRPDHRAHEVACGMQLDVRVLAHRAARIDRQHQRQRHVRLALEVGNLLRHSVLSQREVVLLQPPHRRPLRVRHVHKHVHQVDVDMEPRRVRRGRLLSRSGNHCQQQTQNNGACQTGTEQAQRARPFGRRFAAFERTEPDDRP